MKLSQLLKNVNVSGGMTEREQNIEITSVCCDSRHARKDSAFVCIVGALSDGHVYARSAYERGCRVFVAEREAVLPPDALVFIVPNTRIALAEMSQEFFGHPAKKLKIIGITGTKGKTTVARLIHHVLSVNGKKTGYIGTNGVLFDGKFIETVNTTPESYNLAEYMRQMVDSGVEYLALEVSSQSLYLNRVYGLEFDSCVFTNLSPDHIGEREHPSFEHYRDCKARLFSDFPLNEAFYNADESASEYMMKNCKSSKIGFSVEGKGDINASGISLFRDGARLGVKFTVETASERGEVKLSIPGEHNVSNALPVISVCMRAGLKLSQILPALESAEVKGRFEIVDALPYATFVIDYAHNGVSLRSALETLRAYKPHKLICLFGSVGGRTQMRRGELGAVASELADYCILTADNPDNEPVENIIKDIEKGFVKNACPHISIPSRREAVLHAVKIAQSGDIVLFAGKGHEEYQLVNGKKEPFCERDTIIEGAFGMLLGR